MAKGPKTAGTGDTALVKALADILDEAGLAELEYETADLSVRLSRVAGASTPAPAVAPTTSPAADPASHPGAVTSPMVGTAYTAPEPDAPAFVSVGDAVKKGQTILIVEAMKVMNPITAPADGKVTQIMVQNGQPVEFGEVLVIIE
jgi:acetyl-CoA carboxylase biotin carboxyl carrier protein